MLKSLALTNFPKSTSRKIDRNNKLPENDFPKVETQEASIEPVSPQELRHAMRQWPTGVTIVTVSHQDIRHGMTVSSFTSLSLEPPWVLISLDRSSRTYHLVAEAGHFGVIFLSGQQRAISERFARRETEAEDRFAGLETHTLVSGAPFLGGGLGCLDCRVVTTIEAGSNTLFIGEVLAARSGEGELPLVYFNRQYRQLQE